MSSSPPNQALPPTTSSALAAKQVPVARAITSRLNEENRGREVASQRGSEPVSSTPPPARSMTLGEAVLKLSKPTDIEEDGWSPGSYLKGHSPQVRKSGASLAGAAVKRLGG